MPSRRGNCISFSRFAVAALALAAPAAMAQFDAKNPLEQFRELVYVIPQEPQISTLYHNGSQIEITGEQRWRFMCGSDLSEATRQFLIDVAETHIALFEMSPPSIIVDGERGPGLNVVYSLDASVPSAAAAGFARAETYLEASFGDPISFTVNCSFQNLGGGVIGATGSNFVTNVSWTNSRAGLVSGMDANDSIQTSLPTGSSIPVRFNGASATVTARTTVNWTRAGYRATVGTVGGSAGSMVYNSAFSFDYDPSNGVPGSLTSFVDVVVHETGHAMGFISGADNQSASEFHALDAFRFQNTDGTGDYNPDTLAEFGTTPRTVDYNTPNDDANFDMISVEYRMSDGNPWQASHFREQSPPIGQMDPAVAGGQTHFPNYFLTSDFNVFDAIGWDYPPCTPPTINPPPVSQTVCIGGNVSMSVSTNAPSPAYQWRRGTTNLTNGGRISGATSATLNITGVIAGDAASDYNCRVTSNNCTGTSDNSQLVIDTGADFTTQPQPQTVDVEGDLFLSVAVVNPNSYTYQWFRGQTQLSNNARTFGATSPSLFISPTELGDAGNYSCRVTPTGGGCVSFSEAATVIIACTSVNITSQPPVTQTVCRGGTAMLSVATTATTPAYQWRKGVTNLVNGGSISGATSATLSISNVQTTDAASNYNCVITDTSTTCVATSNNSALVVDPSGAQIAEQPVDTSVDEGTDLVLSVDVVNPGNFTYRWRRNTTPLSDGGAISGATSPTLLIQPAALADAGNYDCVITPTAGSCVVTSAVAVVTVNPLTPPCPEDINQNGTVDLSDLAVLLTNFGTPAGATPAMGDLDGDGDVDLSDLARLLAVFGAPCP